MSYNKNYFSNITVFLYLLLLKNGLSYMYNSIFINYDIIHITTISMMSDIHIPRNIS